jgi:hypothetical protein
MTIWGCSLHALTLRSSDGHWAFVSAKVSWFAHNQSVLRTVVIAEFTHDSWEDETRYRNFNDSFTCKTLTLRQINYQTWVCRPFLPAGVGESRRHGRSPLERPGYERCFSGFSGSTLTNVLSEWSLLEWEFLTRTSTVTESHVGMLTNLCTPSVFLSRFPAGPTLNSTPAQYTAMNGASVM